MTNVKYRLINATRRGAALYSTLMAFYQTVFLRVFPLVKRASEVIIVYSLENAFLYDIYKCFFLTTSAESLPYNYETG